MDGPHFDSLLRVLSVRQPRRGALVGVLGGLLAGTPGLEAEAKKTRQKRKDKSARVTKQDHDASPKGHCIKQGRPVIPCCPGLVARSDGVCAISICFTGVNPCEDFQQCPNTTTRNCGCYITAEGDPFCGLVTDCGAMATCVSSGDCLANEKCVRIATPAFGPCCGSDQRSGMCMPACPEGA